VLGIGNHEIPGWVVKLTSIISNNNKGNWNKKQYAGKAFNSRAMMGHWYPIVSIDFHQHAMTNMMVLMQGYALDFVSFGARKPCQGIDYPRWGC